MDLENNFSLSSQNDDNISKPEQNIKIINSSFTSQKDNPKLYFHDQSKIIRLINEKSHENKKQDFDQLDSNSNTQSHQKSRKKSNRIFGSRKTHIQDSYNVNLLNLTTNYSKESRKIPPNGAFLTKILSSGRTVFINKDIYANDLQTVSPLARIFSATEKQDNVNESLERVSPLQNSFKDNFLKREDAILFEGNKTNINVFNSIINESDINMKSRNKSSRASDIYDSNLSTKINKDNDKKNNPTENVKDINKIEEKINKKLLKDVVNGHLNHRYVIF